MRTTVFLSLAAATTVLAVTAVTGAAGPAPSLAATPHGACLSKEQQRAAIAGREALPLAGVLHQVRSQSPGEIVKARLCWDDQKLAYLLTVLAHDGKVTRVVVDAGNGKILGGR